MTGKGLSGGNNNFIKSLVVLVVLTSLGFGILVVFSFFTNQSQQPASQPLPPTAIDTPANQSDPKLGWKTYSNTVFGYTMKYPLEWLIVEAKPKTLVTISNYDSNTRKSNQFLPGDIKIEIYSNAPEFISVPNGKEVQPFIFNGHSALMTIEEQSTLSQKGIYDLSKVQTVYFDVEKVRYGIAIYFARETSDSNKKVQAILDTFRLTP